VETLSDPLKKHTSAQACSKRNLFHKEARH